MNIEWLTEFTMVAKHGNLSQAARELHTTQSALSRHLAALEEELGGELYDRSRNPMELTRMGEMLLRESNIIACQDVRIRELAERIRKETAMTITVGGALCPTAGKILRAIRSAEPVDSIAYQIRFENNSSQTPFHLIRRHVVDVAIEPISSLIDIHDLEHDHIFSEAMFVVVQPDHEVAGCEYIDVEALPDMDFISLLGNTDHATRKHLQQMVDDHGDRGTLPRRLFASPQSHNYEELFFNGLEGAAVALPKSIALRYTAENDGDYVAIPVKGEGTDYDFQVFYAKDCPAKTRGFVQRLLEEAQRLGLA